MSNRALFPSSVRARTATLTYGEESAGESVRDLAMDLVGSGGRLSGLTITCDGTLTTINSIAAGVARVPNGERVELTAAVTGTGLADVTNGVSNFVGLVYYETSTVPYATVTSGSDQNTQVQGNTRVVVLTAAQLAALPETSTDQSVNALDRLVLIGVVTGAGSGVPIPAANVSQLPTSDELRGVSSNVGTALPGISIVSVQNQAPLGVATFSYTAATGVLTLEFATGGVGAGTSDLRTGTTQTSIAGGSGHTMTIDVVRELLPLTDASTTVTVTAPLMDTDNALAPAGVVDAFLRSFLGGSVRTGANPLGLSGSDLGALLATVIPGAISLGVELLTSTLGNHPRLVFPASAGALTQAAIFPLSTSSVRYARLYYGDQRLVLTINARHVNASTTWFADDTGTQSLRMTVDLSALTLTISAGADAGSGVVWATQRMFNWATTGALATLGSGVLASALATRARVAVPYGEDSGDDRTVLAQSSGVDTPTNNDMRLMRIASATDHLELTYNAAYTNGSGTPWARVSNSFDSYRLVISIIGIYLQWHAVGDATPWADGAWDLAWQLDTGGTIAAETSVVAPDFAYDAPGTVVKRWMPGPPVVPTGWNTVIAEASAGTTPTVLSSTTQAGVAKIASLETGAIFPLPPLPDGVTISQITMTGNVSLSGASDVTLGLFRQAANGTIVGMHTSMQNATAGTGATTTLAIDANNVVDNSQYTYMAYVYANTTGFWRLFSFAVTHSVTGPADGR